MSPSAIRSTSPLQFVFYSQLLCFTYLRWAAFLANLGKNFNEQLSLDFSMCEYFRPWKLISLAVGVALLIAGSFYYNAPDWDIPISLIMAALAYLTAPWSIRILLERKWRLLPLMLLATWFTVDGSYWIYWHFKNPVALEMMREANFFASLALYGMCGVIWLHRGSLKELVYKLIRPARDC